MKKNYEPFGKEWKNEVKKWNKDSLIEFLRKTLMELQEVKNISSKQFVNDDFIFTPENLLDSLDKLGPWSAYGLASFALKHYFPDEYDENDSCDVSREVKLLAKIRCKYWEDVIIKYHKEVGYSALDLNEDYVNAY